MWACYFCYGCKNNVLYYLAGRRLFWIDYNRLRCIVLIFLIVHLFAVLKALYSLAYLVQAGTHIPPSIWQLLGLKDSVLESNSSILTELYSRSVSFLDLALTGSLVQFINVFFVDAQCVFICVVVMCVCVRTCMHMCMSVCLCRWNVRISVCVCGCVCKL